MLIHSTTQASEDVCLIASSSLAFHKAEQPLDGKGGRGKYIGKLALVAQSKPYERLVVS
jgi:hypothetical protein